MYSNLRMRCTLCRKESTSDSGDAALCSCKADVEVLADLPHAPVAVVLSKGECSVDGQYYGPSILAGMRRALRADKVAAQRILAEWGTRADETAEWYRQATEQLRKFKQAPPVLMDLTEMIRVGTTAAEAEAKVLSDAFTKRVQSHEPGHPLASPAPIVPTPRVLECVRCGAPSVGEFGYLHREWLCKPCSHAKVAEGAPGVASPGSGGAGISDRGGCVNVAVQGTDQGVNSCPREEEDGFTEDYPRPGSAVKSCVYLEEGWFRHATCGRPAAHEWHYGGGGCAALCPEHFERMSDPESYARTRHERWGIVVFALAMVAATAYLAISFATSPQCAPTTTSRTPSSVIRSNWQDGFIWDAPTTTTVQPRPVTLEPSTPPFRTDCDGRLYTTCPYCHELHEELRREQLDISEY